MSEHYITSIKRDPRGHWFCKTLSGEWVNVFAPSSSKPGTLRYFQAAGYGDCMVALQAEETIRFSRHPIAVEMIKSGQYWEIVSVMPGEAEPDVALVPEPAKYRRAVQAWAQRLLQQQFVVLDTETTGIQPHDEPIQIGVIGVLRDSAESYDRPVSFHIQPSDWSLLEQANGAKQVHGITRADLETARNFNYHYVVGHLPDLNRYMVVGYNVGFDLERLDYACMLWELEPLRPLAVVDIMPRVAEYIGLWDAVKERWQPWRLSETAEILGIGDRDDHDALGDCRTTLALVQAMAAGVEPDMTAAGRIKAEKEAERA